MLYVGEKLVVPYSTNIRNIVNNLANYQAERLLAGHILIQESVLHHTPCTALQSDEMFIILHDNQPFPAETLLD